VWFARRRARYERPEGFATERYLDDLLDHESFARRGLDPGAVRRALLDAAPGTYADAVRATFACYAAHHGKPRYADKTPVFVTYIPVLAELFPESVFVHVVRDGRDVVLSRAEANWGTNRAELEALLWRTQIERGRADGRRLGPRRYMELRYEELLDDPERAARRLCELAALDFDPGMLEYHRRAEQVLADQPYPEEHRNLLRPPTKGLRDWRTQCDPRQVEVLECLIGPTLGRFDYERTVARPSARAAAKALGVRARYASIAGYRKVRAAAWRRLHERDGG
jgi:hypothetical protein